MAPAITASSDPTTFAGLQPRGLDQLHGIAVAVLGASHASPYKPGLPSHAAEAPAALRAASGRFARQLEQYDFDLGGSLCRPDIGLTDLADCGDVATDPHDPAGNRQRIAAAVRQVLQAGAAPLVLGGDDSVPIPVFQAFEGRGPITILQIDAHVDWGDCIAGNALGYGSTMRRAAELPWIAGMVQVGMRGLGSGTADQLADARGWGSTLVPMAALRRDGLAPVAACLPEGGAVFVSIDCDGLDPAVLPAVNMPTPGGLWYDEVVGLLHLAATRGRIVGCNLVELVPRLDRDGLSALTAARLAMVAMGLMRPPI